MTFRLRSGFQFKQGGIGTLDEIDVEKTEKVGKRENFFPLAARTTVPVGQRLAGCYKTFYVRNLRIFVIVCPRQAFQA